LYKKQQKKSILMTSTAEIEKLFQDTKQTDALISKRDSLLSISVQELDDQIESEDAEDTLLSSNGLRQAGIELFQKYEHDALGSIRELHVLLGKYATVKSTAPNQNLIDSILAKQASLTAEAEKIERFKQALTPDAINLKTFTTLEEMIKELNQWKLFVKRQIKNLKPQK
jgi:superfamily I DNA and RNA helicase